MKNRVFYIAILLLATFYQGQAQAPNGARNAGICPLYIPNAFTPNGDNINDRFVLSVSEDCEVLNFEIQIFDRWGQMVYESKELDPSKAWDGQFDSNYLQQGLYLYKISAELYSYTNRSNSTRSEKINKQGSVVLIR
jgi:gliding motility-associated-like protein